MITILIIAYLIQFIVVLAVISCDIEEEKGSQYRYFKSKKDLLKWITPFRWVLVVIVLVWKWWKSLE